MKYLTTNGKIKGIEYNNECVCIQVVKGYDPIFDDTYVINYNSKEVRMGLSYYYGDTWNYIPKSYHKIIEEMKDMLDVTLKLGGDDIEKHS